ncbi:MAG TPA: NADH-quinone oxidoreductase subunit J [Anaerolineales bacterium]|nr:NADH-quinone oxidoreductase subunit J [Anaerolineales bacterium]
MLSLLLILVAAVFAIQAIRAKGLIPSALWLAGVSALSSLVFYLYGAHQVAVIELSVGAGLVTVLFVLAINIAGDAPLNPQPLLPPGLTIGLALLFVLVLGWFGLAGFAPAAVPAAVPAGTESDFARILWQDRGLDVLVQVILIFSGVLGFLGLLAEVKGPLSGSLAEQVSAGRERDLKALEDRVQEHEERVQ